MTKCATKNAREKRKFTTFDTHGNEILPWKKIPWHEVSRSVVSCHRVTHTRFVHTIRLGMLAGVGGFAGMFEICFASRVIVNFGYESFASESGGMLAGERAPARPARSPQLSPWILITIYMILTDIIRTGGRSSRGRLLSLTPTPLRFCVGPN